MKSILVILILFAGLNADASRRQLNFSVKVEARTEAEVLTIAEDTMAQIKNASHRQANALMRFQNCSVRPQYIEIRGVSVSKIFKPDQNGRLQEFHVGRIDFRNKRCEKDD